MFLARKSIITKTFTQNLGVPCLSTTGFHDFHTSCVSLKKVEQRTQSHKTQKSKPAFPQNKAQNTAKQRQANPTPRIQNPKLVTPAAQAKVFVDEKISTKSSEKQEMSPLSQHFAEKNLGKLSTFIYKCQAEHGLNSESVKKIFAAPCTFLGSAATVEQIDEILKGSSGKKNLPIIAFFGRSNVGKSTLLNTVVSNSSLMKTSKTPGRTQTLNFAHVQRFGYFVDVPGYGYATAPVEVVKKWKSLIYGFVEKFSKSRRLTQVYVLLDSRRDELKKSDFQFLQFLQQHSIPFKVVLTKTDSIGVAQIDTRISQVLEQLAEMGMTELPLVIPVSSREKKNIDVLQYSILIDGATRVVPAVEEIAPLPKEEPAPSKAEAQQAIQKEKSEEQEQEEEYEDEADEEQPSVPEKKRDTLPKDAKQRIEVLQQKYKTVKNPYVTRPKHVAEIVSRDKKSKQAFKQIIRRKQKTAGVIKK